MSERDIIGRWIGVDYGTRRIGVAIADTRGRIASPADQLQSLGSPRRDAEVVLRWAAQREAGGIVIGLPLNMDGTDSRQTRVTRVFADELRRQSSFPIELWDERLSSFQADQHLAAAGARGARRRQMRDALAAQVILQSFLDARHPPDAGPDAGQAPMPG